MKKDIEFLLSIVGEFCDAFDVSESYLRSEKEDAIFRNKIEKIRKKYQS